MKKKSFKTMPVIAGGFVAGAVILNIFATCQKLIFGTPLLTPIGFIVPSLLGGISGAVIAWQFTRLRRRAKNMTAERDFFRDILNAVPQYIWSSRLENNREITVYSSASENSLTGYPRGYLKSVDDWLKIVHPDDKEKVMASIGRQHSGEAVDIKYRVIHADGTPRWVRAITIPTFDAAGHVAQLYGAIDDITEQKRTEQKLHESKNRYHLLFEQSPVPLWEEDFSAGKVYIDRLRAEGIIDFETYFDEYPAEVEKLAGMVKVLDVNQSTLHLHKAEKKVDLLAGLPKIFGAEANRSLKEEILALINGATEFSINSTVYTLNGTPVHVTVAVNLAPGAEHTWNKIFVSTTNITEQVETERAAAQLRDNLMKAQQIAHLGNWDWNMVTNELIWTDEVYRIFGLKPQDGIATYERFLNFVHPDDRDSVTAAVNRSLEDPAVPFRVKHRVVRVDGSICIVQEIGEMSFDDMGNPMRMFGTAQDITERETIEIQLRESEQKYRNLIDNSPIGIVILREGKIAYANPTLAEMMGYTIDELVGKPMLAFIHPDFKEMAKRRLGKLMQGNNIRVEAMEEKMYRKDGTIIDALVLGQSIIHEGAPAIQGYIYDITANKQMQYALAESEERYRQLIEFLPQTVVVHVGGKIKYTNPAGLKLVGATSFDDVIDLQLLDFVHPDDRALIAQRIHNLMVHKIPLSISEVRIICLDGSIIYAETSGHPITFRGEEGVLSIISDITARRQLTEQLRQSQKMEAVGRLAGGVAHDFNNLLTAMMGYAGLLEPQLPPDGEAIHDLIEIKKATDRAAGLVRQLLAFSRQQIIQPRSWNLNDSINNIKKMLQRLIGETIELSTFLDDDLATIKIDPGHVEQIIMNLAVNARDAMPSGGKLTIETTNIQLDETYARRHAEVTPGDYVLLAISDTGDGIPPETLEHIFEPFFTTKDVGKGTGLGLATVHGIVKQSNGHIWVYSEMRKGTTFKIYFPGEPLSGNATHRE